MTQEEKQLLLIDICARQPYGVIVDNPNPAGDAWDEVINIDTSAKTVTLLYDGRVFSIDNIKPYLRSMNSMTEEEKKEIDASFSPTGQELFSLSYVDWLNAHHFDYRIVPSTGKSMIESGLALKAPEEMYK